MQIQIVRQRGIKVSKPANKSDNITIVHYVL